MRAQIRPRVHRGPVPQAVKNALFQAAIQAPTAGNQMLYTILDITDAVLKARRPTCATISPSSRTHPWCWCSCGLPALVRRLCRGGLRTPSAAGGRPAAGRGGRGHRRTVVAAESFRPWQLLHRGYSGKLRGCAQRIGSASYAVPLPCWCWAGPRSSRGRRKPARF